MADESRENKDFAKYTSSNIVKLQFLIVLISNYNQFASKINEYKNLLNSF